MQGSSLYLDYTYADLNNQDNVNINFKKHSSIKDCLNLHWPSQKWIGYSEKFRELLKKEIDHIYIGPTFDFLWETYFDFEGTSIDDFESEFLKIKKLKKITSCVLHNLTIFLMMVIIYHLRIKIMTVISWINLLLLSTG